MPSYRINEIFYSLQGEGFFTGTPALFIRFSGCNLRCSFCDTRHETGEMLSLCEIVRHATECPARHVVLTGGEPSLFIDDALVDALHAVGKFVAIETNGTHTLPANIDWVTLSPKTPYIKEAPPIVLTHCDELKVVFNGALPATFPDIKAQHHFLQPCDTGNSDRNMEIISAAIHWLLAHPTWQLSLQTHKLIGIR